jgi:hypothetical protein
MIVLAHLMMMKRNLALLIQVTLTLRSNFKKREIDLPETSEKKQKKWLRNLTKTLLDEIQFRMGNLSFRLDEESLPFSLSRAGYTPTRVNCPVSIMKQVDHWRSICSI